MAIVLIDENTGRETVIENVKTEQTADFREIYVTGTMGGGFGPYDMRMSFYDTKIEKQKDKKIVEKRLVKGTIIMPYASSKQLYIWLGKQLADYEKRAGCKIFIGPAEPETPNAEGGE